MQAATSSPMISWGASGGSCAARPCSAPRAAGALAEGPRCCCLARLGCGCAGARGGGAEAIG
eukprot:6159742-Pyramimonas_sp.AAC.1